MSIDYDYIPPGREPEENAVVRRLAANWQRRAAVKLTEPDLASLFEAGRPDYPERLIPFRDHPAYARLDPAVKARVMAWAWIAFNKNIMDIEQQVVHPGFALLAADTFQTGMGESTAQAITQAMVDEQYHTLMHLSASAATRRGRGWHLPESALPLAYKARRLRERLAAAEEEWQRQLTMLAFTTVAEVSINAYLDLIANDDLVQPMNRTTAALHSRDEYCHSAITAEVAKVVYAQLRGASRRYFLDALADGLEAFAANDYTTWERIAELTHIDGGGQLVRDVMNAPDRKRLLQDFSGLYKLCTEMRALPDITFDWSTVSTS